MIALEEEQWELDGVVFGRRTPLPVLADGMDTGTTERRTQDVDRPHGDGAMFGRDYFNAPEWTLQIGAIDSNDVWPLVYRLAAAWRADNIRKTPGAMSVLRYRRAGVTYRLLGRPQQFGLTPGKVKDDEFQQATCTFKLNSSEYYIEQSDGSTRMLDLRLVQAPSTGGLIGPAVAPWHTRASTAQRMGEVVVGGALPAPFTVQVFGPTISQSMTGFTISGDDWVVSSTATLAWDQVATIDMMANSIIRSDGLSLAGTLTTRSRMTARLRPGHQFVTFQANDSTGTARALLTWYDTIPA